MPENKRHENSWNDNRVVDLDYINVNQFASAVMKIARITRDKIIKMHLTTVVYQKRQRRNQRMCTCRLFSLQVSVDHRY